MYFYTLFRPPSSPSLFCCGSDILSTNQPSWLKTIDQPEACFMSIPNLFPLHALLQYKASNLLPSFGTFTLSTPPPPLTLRNRAVAPTLPPFRPYTPPFQTSASFTQISSAQFILRPVPSISFDPTVSHIVRAALFSGPLVPPHHHLFHLNGFR